MACTIPVWVDLLLVHLVEVAGATGLLLQHSFGLPDNMLQTMLPSAQQQQQCVAFLQNWVVPG